MAGDESPGEIVEIHVLATAPKKSLWPGSVGRSEADFGKLKIGVSPEANLAVVSATRPGIQRAEKKFVEGLVVETGEKLVNP